MNESNERRAYREACRNRSEYEQCLRSTGYYGNIHMTFGCVASATCPRMKRYDKTHNIKHIKEKHIIMESKQILAQAIQKYGVEAQQRQCIEECSELITAILHHQRRKCDNQAVVTEIADVIIMCEQMKLVYGAQAVDDEIKAKMKRLTERLDYVVEK